MGSREEKREKRKEKREKRKEKREIGYKKRNNNNNVLRVKLHFINKNSTQNGHE